MPFDPSQIPLFSVIRIPYEFEGVEEPKRFVVIGHVSSFAICVKVTSRMERYARAELAAGVVIYEEGEVQCLQRRTAVQPDNQIPIAYEQLVRHQRANRLEILEIGRASCRERV